MRSLGLCVALLTPALCASLVALRGADAAANRIASPDAALTAELILDGDGVPRYTIARNAQPVLQPSRLGLVRDDGDFSRGLRLESASASERVEDSYEIFTSKRRQNHYVANRRTFHFANAAGQKLDVIFQVSNGGVAFRYHFPEPGNAVRKINEELTSFHFLAGTRAWLQPMSVAKTGWERVNPCYEEYYEKDIPVGTKSPLAGWVFPALFRSGDVWISLTEGSLGRNYCGTRLRAESPEGEYTIGFPDPRENFQGGAVNPESTLPWTTPWRIVAVGSLKTLMESTLGTDLAEKPAQANAGRAAAEFARLPGKASWSWPLMGDRNTNYDVQKRFIDYAAEMRWRYCLIDALWDKQIGYEKVTELIGYAKTKNVGILLWYNSAGDWCGAPQTPRDKMLTHESRVAEFTRLKQMGVAGLKIDFFGGDGQSQIAYYHDILADAAPFGFAMNFHGATLPRGWNRTFPQLMTMEAVKGLEFVTFEQKNADEEPAHACTLPFARNLYDPMDFTPVVLDRINRIQRRTSSAFELALSVVFTSGIQHYAEIPDGMAKAPDYVRDFLQNVPGVWDDVKFLDGFPGRYVVVARRSGDRWWIAGINGEPAERKLTLDLAELRAIGEGAARGVPAEPSDRGSPGTDRPTRRSGELITDGIRAENLSFRHETAAVDANGKLELTLQPRGGFVMTTP